LFFLKDCCFVFLFLKTEVDYSGRCETPVGIVGMLRPCRSDRDDEEAHLKPHGKGASWSCNQLPHSKNKEIEEKATIPVLW
jgi:hypothetical protein